MFKKIKFTNRKIFNITLVVVAIHLVLTSAIDFYIFRQVTTQTVKIDKEIRAKIFEAPRNYPRQKLEAEVTELAQKSKEKTEEIYRRWKIPDFVISLPIARFIWSPLSDFMKKRQYKFLSNDISGARLRTEAAVIVFAGHLANSLAFGLLIYAIIMIFNRKLKLNKQRDLTRKKPRRKSGAGRG